MELQVFQNNGFKIRGGLIGDKPYFVAKDVCTSLGIEWQGSNNIIPLDEDEKGFLLVETQGGGKQKMIAVNESGLYTLIFRSNKPEAKKFRKWVTSEVLPSIRKTGSYSITQDIEHDNRAFYEEYGTLNINNQFYIRHRNMKALAYADIHHGFLISGQELARLTCTSPVTIRVTKLYFKEHFISNVHTVTLGRAKVFFTRLGAGFIGLHSGDGSVGRYLLSKEIEKQLDADVKLLRQTSEELISRFEALGGAKWAIA